MKQMLRINDGFGKVALVNIPYEFQNAHIGVEVVTVREASDFTPNGTIQVSRFLAAVKALIQSDNRIEAIQLVRDYTNGGLYEAKQIVDEMEENISKQIQVPF
jgi:ribosomal protein L7/L12